MIYSKDILQANTFFLLVPHCTYKFASEGTNPGPLFGLMLTEIRFIFFGIKQSFIKYLRGPELWTLIYYVLKMVIFLDRSVYVKTKLKEIDWW